jgi:hypothetical protein
MFRVQHDQGHGEWVDAVREDLNEGNNEGLDQVAEFDSMAAAVQFVDDMRGMMHMGGDDVRFRVREVDTRPERLGVRVTRAW